MIVILTSGYPFGGEPFLISENNYTPKDAIYISLDPQNKKANENFTGQAFKVHSKKNKIKSLKYVVKGIFDKTFWNEIRNLINKKRFSLLRFYQLVCFYGGSMKCYEEVQNILTANNLIDENTIIYSYWMSYHAFIAAMLKKNHPIIKCVTRCHGYDIYEYRSRTEYLPFRETIFKEMDAIFPISMDGANYLKNTYGDYVFQKAHISYLGTEGHGIFWEAINRTDCFNIVSCSSLISLKRVDKIIMSLSKIQNQKIRWTHYGDGPLKAQLVALAENELDNIEFCFYGQIDNDILMKKYSNHYYDLFINVSSSEGIPVSIMEAMSFGIPVLATDVGGTSEIVKNETNGFLIPKDFDVSVLSSLIERYMNKSIEQQNYYRKQAYDTWNSKFNAKKNYSNFYNAITDIT